MIADKSYAEVRRHFAAGPEKLFAPFAKSRLGPTLAGGVYRFAYHVPGATTVITEPPGEHAGIESEVHVAITSDGSGSELVIRHEKLRRTDAIERHALAGAAPSIN
jgi:hypothetical protein